MIVSFPALFFEEDFCFRVEVPNFSECHAIGTSLPEVYEAALTKLKACIALRLEVEGKLPRPVREDARLYSEDAYISILSINLEELDYKEVHPEEEQIPDWLSLHATLKGICLRDRVKRREDQRAI